MTIDLDEAKDRAERGLLLTARHGEALVAELKRLRDYLARVNADFEKAERDLYLKLGECEARLERYEEREPLVQQLVLAVDPEFPANETAAAVGWIRKCERAAEAVRDFEVIK